MKTRRAAMAMILLSSFLLAIPGADASAQERKTFRPQSKDSPLKELISGYYFTPLAQRSLQDDDFDNPAFVWSAQGERLWSQVDGANRKSCLSCHGNAGEAMRGKAATYPKYYEPAKTVINLEQRINICRQEKMQATAWSYESDQLLAITAFVRLQSRRMPISVKIDGPAAQTFAQGKQLYFARNGQYGMACAQCHNERFGSNLLSETISQGHPNGAPAYRASTQKLTSLHERIRACYGLMHAEPYENGAPELVALELYLNWRANGLPLEAPAVRP